MSAPARREPGSAGPAPDNSAALDNGKAIVPDRCDRPPLTASRHHGSTLAYLASRERVLGHRVTLTMADATIAAEQLSEAFGGRAAALAYALDVAQALRGPR